MTSDPHVPASTPTQNPEGPTPMTNQHGAADDQPTSARYRRLLATTIDALTEAARLTWPPRDGVHRQPVDWAEFVTNALAGAAANVGSTEQALAGRPGSWEAAGVRGLLAGTVGPDDEHLQLHRTQPVVVTLTLADILDDLDAAEPYLEAAEELDRRYSEIDLPSDAVALDEDTLTAEQLRQVKEHNDLEDQLEQLRQADWSSYAADLTAAVTATANMRGILPGQLVVQVDLDQFPTVPTRTGQPVTVADELRMHAVDVTPFPWAELPPPLQRLPAGGDNAQPAHGSAPRTTAAPTRGAAGPEGRPPTGAPQRRSDGRGR
jgi:hypothetical protein